jgi:hypothetical protein
MSECLSHAETALQRTELLPSADGVVLLRAIGDCMERGLLPDRLSVEKDSPFFDSRYRHVGVRVQGQDVTNVIEYDKNSGWILQGIRDSAGRWKMERGRVVTVKRFVPFDVYWRS